MSDRPIDLPPHMKAIFGNMSEMMDREQVEVKLKLTIDELGQLAEFLRKIRMADKK